MLRALDSILLDGIVWGRSIVIALHTQPQAPQDPHLSRSLRLRGVARPASHPDRSHHSAAAPRLLRVTAAEVLPV